MGGKQSGSYKTRSSSLGNPVAQRVCGYCGAPCERKYCGIECYRAKQRSQPVEVRFWAKVNKTETCWLWTASRSGGRSGGRYGQFQITVGPNQLKHVSAHTWAYQAAYGPVPDGLEVMHTCHNRLCVRPDHLKVGTRLENVQASVAQGHYRVPHPKRQKLTADQIAELRNLAALGEKQIRLAERFGISETLVSFLMRGGRRQHDAPLHQKVG